MSLSFTFGGLFRVSVVEVLNDNTLMMAVDTGGFLGADPIPLGRQPILQAYCVIEESVFEGSVLVSSHWRLSVQIFDIDTFLMTEVLSIEDPWEDPIVGFDVNVVRYSDVTEHRLAIAFQTSTETGGDTYANDGSITVYVDDAVVGTATALHFARGGFGASAADYITTAYSNIMSLDRVWARAGIDPPTTDVNGVLLDSSHLIYYDDFPGGDLSAWSPFPDGLPNMVSSMGGSESYGLSFSEAAVSSLILDSGPFVVGGIIRLVDVPAVDPDPDPPATAGCPVAILP